MLLYVRVCRGGGEGGVRACVRVRMRVCVCGLRVRMRVVRFEAANFSKLSPRRSRNNSSLLEPCHFSRCNGFLMMYLSAF